jgi:hypothetical protein
MSAPEAFDDCFFMFENKDGTFEEICIETDCLARMLEAEVLMANGLNGGFFENKQAQTVLYVLCSDTFAYACADCEDLPYGEIGPLYKLWKAHGWDGVTKWCALRRGARPLPVYEKSLREKGIWDDAMNALPERLRSPQATDTTNEAKGK